MKRAGLTNQGVFATLGSSTKGDAFQETTEAMSEILAQRVPRLLKALDALQKKTKASDQHRSELRAWIDKENGELLCLKEAIAERKRSFLEAASAGQRQSLASFHPVWMTSFNVYIEQIIELYATQRDGRTIIHCKMPDSTFNSLRIYYYASGSDLLCVNSHRNLPYASCPDLVGREPVCNLSFSDEKPYGEYVFHPIAGGKAQWLFTGCRWGIDENVVWLDFGDNDDDCIRLPLTEGTH